MWTEMLLAVPLDGAVNLDATITPAGCQHVDPPLTVCPNEDEAPEGGNGVEVGVGVGVGVAVGVGDGVEVGV